MRQDHLTIEGPPGAEARLEAVLAELCRRLGPLVLTKAVKLPYLVDVVAVRILGRPISSSTYQTWKWGVVNREIWDLIKYYEGGEFFQVARHGWFGGGQEVRLRDVSIADRLTEAEREIVAFVADEFGRLDADELGKLTKSMNPEIEPAEWGQNQPANVSEDAYARLSVDWQDLWSHLQDSDLSDRAGWGQPIQDPRAYVRGVLSG